MTTSITEEQFIKAFKLSTTSAKKKWQFTTDRAIAQKVGKAENKDEMIAKIYALLKMEMTEAEFLKRLDAL